MTKQSHPRNYYPLVNEFNSFSWYECHQSKLHGDWIFAIFERNLEQEIFASQNVTCKYDTMRDKCVHQE